MWHFSILLITGHHVLCHFKLRNDPLTFGVMDLHKCFRNFIKFIEIYIAIQSFPHWLGRKMTERQYQISIKFIKFLKYLCRSVAPKVNRLSLNSKQLENMVSSYLQNTKKSQASCGNTTPFIPLSCLIYKLLNQTTTLLSHNQSYVKVIIWKKENLIKISLYTNKGNE